MIFNVIKLSLKSVWKNKMRSVLTMLGMIIGVMAVVVLVSVTQNTTSGIAETISSMGSDQITANISDEDTQLTPEALESLVNGRTISGIAPVITANQTVKHKDTAGNFSIVGITPSYFEVQNVTVQSGRMITETDLEWKTNVAVIGTEVASDLFGTWDAVGGTLSFGERNYTVIGVLEEQGSSLAGSDDSKILIPYSTAERLTGQSGVSTFYIKAASTQSVNMAINTVESFLLQATRDEDAFTVSNQSDVLDTMEDVTDTMSLLLGGIAAISLLVGGIGIMNIMLVSVTERTREIGIRKAVGAKRRHILLQFLSEACILSVLGGLIGLGFSFAFLSGYNLISGSSAAMNWGIGFAALTFCAVIGVIFGSYPALKASKLQPIDALHSI